MKPYVHLNAAMSINGKIALTDKSIEISQKEDKIRVHELRAKYDSIMVGINTILKDNPHLTVKYAKGKNPIRIVIDSRGRTPLNARVLNNQAKTIIVVGNRAPKERIDLLKKHAEIIFCGENEVDLHELMKILWNRGIKSILLEGGGTLNWSMLKGRLVDYISVYIGSTVFGGKNAPTLVNGEGFKDIQECIKLRLVKNYFLNNGIVLEYEVIK
ncbi:MAG: 2,5-diamino-6-(ribosylamino)-4(3H)-pyrimidinone 5'-phosphate reductase [Candidatus Hydrothermarchaeota archaeon]